MNWKENFWVGLGVPVALAGLLGMIAPGKQLPPAGRPPIVRPTGVVQNMDVSLKLAQEIADATLAMCGQNGYGTAVVVVDRAGQVVLMMRSDGATSQMLEMARRKAYTARMFRRSSADWAKRTLDDPVTFPQRDLPDVLALSGGQPINVGDETIGGVGSAGSTQDLDDSCAQAGIDAVKGELHP